MADSVVNLGAGSSSEEGLASYLEYLRQTREVYKEGDARPYRMYGELLVREPKKNTFAQSRELEADRVSPYEGLADPTYEFDTPMEFFPSLIDGSLFPNNIYGKTGQNVPVRPQLEADGSVTVVPVGFDKGGDVQLQDDGSLPGVDDLRFMTPEEVETGSYNYLQDLEDRLRYHVSEAQNPITTEEFAGIPVTRHIQSMRYHREEAEMLREEIDRFRKRRASAVLNYPESDQKLYMKEGQDPYVKSFPDSIVEGYQEGGEVGIASLGMEEDKTGPLEPIPSYAGIEGFDIYENLADPLYSRRPIEKQDFSRKRGFQHGQMVKLNERDDAVGGKLLKQAGIQASASQVMDNLDPKILEQMSRILGRNIG